LIDEDNFYRRQHDLVNRCTEYMSHKWAWKCSVCRKHNQVLSSFMTCHWVCIKSNTTGTTSGTGTTYPSGTTEFTLTLATPKVVWIRQIRCGPPNSLQIYWNSINTCLFPFATELKHLIIHSLPYILSSLKINKTLISVKCIV